MDNGRPFGGLTHHERRGGGEFIGDAHLRHLQFEFEKVFSAAQVFQRGDSCNANRNADSSVSPSASMRVNDEDADSFPAFGLDFASHLFRASVWVGGEEENPVFCPHL